MWKHWVLSVASTNNKFTFFLESHFVGVNSVFVLVYKNQDDASKRLKTKMYYLPKEIFDNYIVLINRKNFYDQPVGSDVKRYEEIRKLRTGLGEDYTTGFLLDYDYIKSHYRLIAVYLSRQKELDADTKGFQ